MLGGGVVAGRVFAGGSAPKRADHAPAVPAALDAATPVALPAATSPVGPAATTGQAAVEQFLRGRIDHDPIASFSSLSAADRGRIGTVDSWRDNNDGLPEYRSYTPARVTTDGHVIEAVELVPKLDEVNGYVPAHAIATFATVAEDGGFRVDLAHTTLEPVAADDAGIAPAAAAWLAARVACSPANEADANLVGRPEVAAALCGATAPATFGSPKPVSGPLGDSVKTAFGPDATRWAKAVDLDGPGRMTIALGPLGDTWVVVGMIGR